MKANELSYKDVMVGDWVRIKITQHNTKVTNIDANSIYTEAVFPIRYDEIEPIPLTDTILKANGFNREGGASYWHEGGRDACILYWSEDKKQLVIGSSCDDCMVKMNVRYIHELQHALRLCGVEKEIEL